MKEQILKKLNLTERGATFILSNKELCKRIMNETPIDVTKFAEKYNFSNRFVMSLIKNDLISWFSNKPLNTNGCRKFIFEEEAIEVIGKGLDNPSFFRVANRTVGIFLQLIEKLPYPKPIELTIIKAAFIDKQSYKQIADDLGRSEYTASDIVSKAERRILRYINKLKTTEQLDKKISEQEAYLLSLKYLVKEVESETKEISSKFKDVKILSRKITDCDFSVRALNTLKVHDVETVGDLVSFNKNDFLKFRDLGKKTHREIVEFVHGLGLKFKNEE